MLIKEYQESWVGDFEKIKNVIQRALKNPEITIEHVGSTAVPNLAAKPIIDIDVIFLPTVDFQKIRSALLKLGYFHNGDQGIAKREVFKRRTEIKKHEVLDEIKHHLYVCPHDSKELRRHLLFRDYLRENKNARIEYQKIKYAIAEEANHDRKVYAQIKEIKMRGFILEILNS